MTITFDKIEKFKKQLEEKFPNYWALNPAQLDEQIIRSFGVSKYFRTSVREALLKTKLINQVDGLYQIRPKPLKPDIAAIDKLNEVYMHGGDDSRGAGEKDTKGDTAVRLGEGKQNKGRKDTGIDKTATL